MTTVSESIRQQESERLMAAFKRARRTMRVTQADIAQVCGWASSSSANRLLNGKMALTLDSLTRISELLGVEPATISPRLAHIASNALPHLQALTIPVSNVIAVSQGVWSEPFKTAQLLPYLTADHGSYGLTFDPDTSPLPTPEHVAVVEPERAASVGDYVVFKQRAGRYCFGRITAVPIEAGFSVQVANKGEVLVKQRQCSVVTAFYSRSMLQGPSH